MTIDDIKLTVLTTMADATSSSAEKHHLMQKVEILRLEERIRAKRRHQRLLLPILYLLVGILFWIVIQPLASSPSPSQSKSELDTPWPLDLTPFTTPARRHSS